MAKTPKVTVAVEPRVDISAFVADLRRMAEAFTDLADRLEAEAEA